MFPLRAQLCPREPRGGGGVRVGLRGPGGGPDRERRPLGPRPSVGLWWDMPPGGDCGLRSCSCTGASVGPGTGPSAVLPTALPRSCPGPSTGPSTALFQPFSGPSLAFLSALSRPFHRPCPGPPRPRGRRTVVGSRQGVGALVQFMEGLIPLLSLQPGQQPGQALPYSCAP